MSEKKYSLDESFKIAVNFHTQGNISEAKKIYEKILIVKPDHLLALGNLGIVFSQLKQFKIAIDIFEKAIKINPKYSEGYNNLGNALFEISEFDKSLNNYKKAVEINPNFSDAFNNLGNVYLKKNDIENAINSYESAISLGKGLNKEKPYYNLGNIFREKGNIDKSIELYNKAIELNPNSVNSYINLSISFSKKGDYKKAVSCCEVALNIDSKNIAALNNLGKYYQEIGEHNLSIDCLNKAIKINPKNLRSKWLLMNIFPIVYSDYGQISFFKNHFEKNVEDLENSIKDNIIYDKEQILGALTSCTNFYLHYQDTDITNLQKRYGNIINKLTKHIYPQYHIQKLKRENFKTIKIGFISSYFCEHVVSKLFKNWIIKLNKSFFETYVYHTGFEKDRITELIKKNCHNFYSESNNIDKMIEKINNDKIDVLIFLDIGMDPKMQILGSLKLAKFQCCTWGVPVTTGLKNIDYFLSSEIMETNFSEEYYSEKLIKLPDLSVDYDEPPHTNILNFDYHRKESKVIFLNLQSSYKLLPQHDHIYFDIIEKNTNCKFWFIGTKNNFISEKFKKRIQLLCNKQKLLIDDFFTFHPKMSYENYLNLISRSDIILDSLGWSGFNTTLDAFIFNKPVITLPGKTMRSRHTYGILKIMKTEDLISHDKKNYVEIALNLSRDPALLEHMNKKIKLNKKILFNNDKTIKFLENFLLSLFKTTK